VLCVHVGGWVGWELGGSVWGCVWGRCLHILCAFVCGQAWAGVYVWVWAVG